MNNVVKLTIHKMSLDAIPAGGGIAAGVAFLSDRVKMSGTLRSSHAWVLEAIAAVRAAAEPNPWKDSTDEEIAGEILKRIEAKKRGQINARSKGLS